MPSIVHESDEDSKLHMTLMSLGMCSPVAGGLGTSNLQTPQLNESYSRNNEKMLFMSNSNKV